MPSGRPVTFRRDPSRGEHDVTVDRSVDDVAHDLIMWLSGRSYGTK